jgi:hypothetical protein
VIQDLLNFIFILVVIKRRAGPGWFASGELFWIVGNRWLQEAGVECGMDLVILWQLEFVRRRIRLGLDDGEGADISIEELGTFALALDFDPQILRAEIH